MDEIRKEIMDIESKIITITGDNLNHLNHWAEDRAWRETVEGMLKQRCNLLNSMFLPTPENMTRFNQVNNHLYTMAHKMYSRIADINATSYYLADEHDFDDDEVVEGWLRVVFDDDSSVLKLDDDDYYGSNFALMIKVLTELYKGLGHEEVEYSDNGINYYDDGTSWMDAPFWNWHEFNDITICHAVHDLTNHKSFSIPDLLRLNDFWCEVQVKFQSITQQDGTRWNKYAQ